MKIGSQVVCERQQFVSGEERRLVMKRMLGWVLVAGLCFGLLCAASAWADEGKKELKEENIALDKAPKPVQETVLKEAGKNEVKAVVKITEGDKTVYEAEWEENDKSVEIVVSPDGKIVSVTRETTIDDVPKAVKETILKEAGSNSDKIKEVEVITEGDKTTYEAEWKDNGKEVDLKVAPDGKVISKESPGEVKEEKLALDKAPKLVQETILKEAGKNEVKEVVKITEGDKTVYEAQWTDNGKKVDLKVAPDGKVISKDSKEIKKEMKEEEKEKKGEEEGEEDE